MDTSLKTLYIHILKYKWTVERQEINTSWPGCYYFVEIESPFKMFDEYILLTEVK